MNVHGITFTKALKAVHMSAICLNSKKYHKINVLINLVMDKHVLPVNTSHLVVPDYTKENLNYLEKLLHYLIRFNNVLVDALYNT